MNENKELCSKQKHGIAFEKENKKALNKVSQLKHNYHQLLENVQLDGYREM